MKALAIRMFTLSWVFLLISIEQYGGDITRRMKLLKRQAEGKKRMKSIANIDVPRETFIKVLKRWNMTPILVWVVFFFHHFFKLFNITSSKQNNNHKDPYVLPMVYIDSEEVISARNVHSPWLTHIYEKDEI